MLTIAIASLFAVWRITGMSGEDFVSGILSLFAPVFVFAASRQGHTRLQRYVIATSLLFVLFFVAFVFLAATSDIVSGFNVVTLIGISWMPQTVVIFFLYRVWKSGLRSAGVDPHSSSRNRKEDRTRDSAR